MCKISGEIREEPTNQDEVMNARSVWRRLYVSVHVHSSDRWGHIQGVEFALQQVEGESTDTVKQADTNGFYLLTVAETSPGYPLN